MSKNKPITPKKEDWKSTDEIYEQPKRDSFSVFVIICCIITLISSIVHELILWSVK